MDITCSKGMQGFASKMGADLESRYPNIMKSIEGISIGKNSDSTKGTSGSFKMGAAIQKSGVFANCDSVVKPYVANEKRPFVVVETDPSVQRKIMDSIESGKTKDQIARDVQQYMHYDAKRNQMVITPVIQGINDSLLTGTATPYWNVGYMMKAFKQPFVGHFAKNLVSVEGFGNPWADMVAVFKESFEGYGRISNVGRGTVETNNSNPVSNAFGQIMTDIVNIAVDYETSVEEQNRMTQPGNFLTGMGISDRQKYAAMVLDRIHNAIILFGNAETGTQGLVDIAGETPYTGTPLNDIVTGVSTTKGSLIVAATNEIIGEFLRSINYMATEIKINVSTYVMKALTMTTYSDAYNPDSPMKTISGNFDAQNSIGGGVQSCKWTLVADPMCDPNTPFNPEDSDLMFITIPSVKSELEDQTGLVIAPEVLSQFIVPPMYQRGGMLYTMYKRIGGIIAPIENTIKVYRGFGYNGA